jgi:hypothetical protein
LHQVSYRYHCFFHYSSTISQALLHHADITCMYVQLYISLRIMLIVSIDSTSTLIMYSNKLRVELTRKNRHARKSSTRKRVICTRSSVISTRMSVISTQRSVISTRSCDFYTQSDFHTQSVISTRTSVISTFTSVI